MAIPFGILLDRYRGRVKAFVVPEINYGQVAYEVERTAAQF